MVLSFKSVTTLEETMNFNPKIRNKQGKGVYMLLGPLLLKMKNILTNEIESSLDINLSVYEEIDIPPDA